MNGVAAAKYKEPPAGSAGHQYNFQHIVLVTKYRYKMFRKQRTIDAIRNAFYDIAELLL